MRLDISADTMAVLETLDTEGQGELIGVSRSNPTGPMSRLLWGEIGVNVDEVDWGLVHGTSEAPDSACFDPDPKYRGEARYILPLSGPKWSPLHAEEHPHGVDWCNEFVVFMLMKRNEARTYPTRSVAGFGRPEDYPDWRIGNSWRCFHDQTNAYLGHYEVVGIVTYDDGIAHPVGQVPERKIHTAVFK